jgi:hypothetical protein
MFGLPGAIVTVLQRGYSAMNRCLALAIIVLMNVLQSAVADEPGAGPSMQCTRSVPYTYGNGAGSGFYPDSANVYLEADGTGSQDPYWIETKSGTTYWLFQGDINHNWSLPVFNNTSTWFTNPNGVVGPYFWIMGVYEHSDGTLIATIHHENAANDGNYNKMKIALAAGHTGCTHNQLGSTGCEWIILGDVAYPSDWNTSNHNIGGTNPVNGGDGYLYVLYLCPGGTCAARAQISAIISTAATNTIPAWSAWYNGGWTGTAAGGNMSAIDAPVSYLGSHTTISRSLRDGKFYMAADKYLFSSPNMVSWTQVSQFLDVCSITDLAGNPTWDGANDAPFYYSWYDPNSPNWNHDNTINQSAWVLHAKIHNGTFGYGYVQTGIVTP